MSVSEIQQQRNAEIPFNLSLLANFSQQNIELAIPMIKNVLTHNLCNLIRFKPW